MDKIEAETGAAGALLSVAVLPPKLDPGQVAAALVNDYGLRGELHPLVSERDQNFQLTTSDGKQYVAKIVSSVEDPDVTEFQIAGLLHLEARNVPGVPRIIRTRSGGVRGNIQSPDRVRYTLRVASWLDGKPLNQCTLDTAIAQGLGRSLARVDQALSSFRHRADSPLLLWDMHRAAELIDLTHHISNASIQRSVSQVLKTFREETTKKLESLPHQVIHNDANPSNILLQKNTVPVTLIDFGDMMRAARVIEVATAAAYLRATEDPLQFIAPFVSAYHGESPLTPGEFDVLYNLVRTRLAMTITILYWRLSARDESDSYRKQSLASEQNAFDFLAALSELGRDRFNEVVARAIESR